MPVIEVGSRAPAFSLRDQEGDLRSLAEFRGRSVVLYFYPEDDTPGCTEQACGFRDEWSEIQALGAVVLGVSTDDAESHRAFAAKHRLPFTLLIDEVGRDGVPRVAGKFGVWREKTLYGRKYTGLVRTTFLIDPAGIVSRRWDHVRVKGHAGAVLFELERAANRPGVVVRRKSASAKARAVSG